MLLGLLAGATISRSSPSQGRSNDALRPDVRRGWLDVNTGAIRFSFGLLDLSDGLELSGYSMGLVAWPTS